MEKKDQFYEEFYKEAVKQAKKLRVIVEITVDNGEKFIDVGLDGRNDMLRVNADSFYPPWEDGEPIEKIVKSFFDIVVINSLSFYNCVKEMNKQEIIHHLRTAVINYEANKEILKEITHERLEDLAVFLKWDFGNGYVTSITNKMFTEIGIAWQELFEAAQRQFRNKIIFKNVNDVIDDFMEGCGNVPFQFENQLCVLTNDDTIDGAALIADVEVMKKIWNTLGGDFYILPSSIHELMILPKKYWKKSPSELAQMVYFINQSDELLEIRLSNNVYEFNGKAIETVVDAQGL